jgi:hypothetical protein
MDMRIAMEWRGNLIAGKGLRGYGGWSNNI